MPKKDGTGPTGNGPKSTNQGQPCPKGGCCGPKGGRGCPTTKK